MFVLTLAHRNDAIVLFEFCKENRDIQTVTEMKNAVWSFYVGCFLPSKKASKKTSFISQFLGISSNMWYAKCGTSNCKMSRIFYKIGYGMVKYKALIRWKELTFRTRQF